MSKITLTFDIDNNFCSVNKKYGTSGNKIEIAKNVRWLINCADAAIQESYHEDAPRRLEMTQLTNNLIEQLKSQLTLDEIEELKLDREPFFR